MGKNDKLFSDLKKDLHEGDPAPPNKPGRGYLADRERAMQDLSTKVYAIQRLVDPAVCRVWSRHNRFYDRLNETRCRDLIDSIRTEGRQLYPATVRRLETPTEDGVEYEVIAGARRLWAVSYLREVEKRDIPYFIEVRELTDKQAFVLADAENRDRQDLTDYERAIDYARAREEFYGGRFDLLQQELNLGRSHLYRLLFLADLPEVVIDALGGFEQVTERSVRPLNPLFNDPSAWKAVVHRAEALAAEQRERAANDQPLIAPPTALKRLMASEPKTTEAAEIAVMDSHGRRVAWVRRSNRRSMAIQIDRRRAATKADLAKALNALVEKIYPET